MKPNNVLEAVDAALAEPKRVRAHDPLSSKLIREVCIARKLAPPKAEITALEAEEEPLRRCREHIQAHALGHVKPEWIAARAADAAQITSGTPQRSITRADLQAQFAESRRTAIHAGLPHAAKQVEIVQKIIFRVCDEIEKSAVELATLSTSALASLLIDKPSDIAEIYRRQAKTLRMFAAKIRPTVYFNWKSTLQQFGIIE